MARLDPAGPTALRCAIVSILCCLDSGSKTAHSNQAAYKLLPTSRPPSRAFRHGYKSELAEGALPFNAPPRLSVMEAGYTADVKKRPRLQILCSSARRGRLMQTSGSGSSPPR